MARVYVGIGTNVNPDTNIKSGLLALERRFGRLDVSRVYANAPVGFAGDEFYNLVVGFDCDDDVETVHANLKAIESDHGRSHDEPKYSSRTLDLDLLTHGSSIMRSERVSIPREDILKYAFVLKPLAEIAPLVRHPELARTYAELWRDFPGERGGLRDVSDLCGDNDSRGDASHAIGETP